MTFEAKTGLNVSNHYGPRSTGGSIGVEHTQDSSHQMRIELTGQSVADAVAGFTPPYYIPKGALFRRATLRVDQAFALSGATPAVEVGSIGSTATNGIALSEAELETIGTKVPVSVGLGTWAFTSAPGIPATIRVAIAPKAGTTIDPNLGKAILILEFTSVSKG